METVKRKASKFESVVYDDVAQEKQAYLKSCFIQLEDAINNTGTSSHKEDAISKLEECYMWIGKIIRDDQIQRNAETALQEQRNNPKP